MSEEQEKLLTTISDELGSHTKLLENIEGYLDVAVQQLKRLAELLENPR